MNFETTNIKMKEIKQKRNVKPERGLALLCLFELLPT